MERATKEERLAAVSARAPRLALPVLCCSLHVAGKAWFVLCQGGSVLAGEREVWSVVVSGW